MYFLWKNCAKNNELPQSIHSKALSLLSWLGYYGALYPKDWGLQVNSKRVSLDELIQVSHPGEEMLLTSLQLQVKRVYDFATNLVAVLRLNRRQMQIQAVGM